MADERVRAQGAGLTLTVTVSAQPAFLDAIEAVAGWFGEYGGCPAEDAARLGTAVRRALERLMGERVAAGAAPRELGLHFEGDARRVRADLSCPPTAGNETFPLEQVLAGGDGLEGLRSLVDRVEFSQDRGRPCCRLTRRIRSR
jgi:hypothetical protein